MSVVENGERVTLSTLYEALMKERDRVDEALGEFRTEISGFRSEQREMARQIGQIHTMVASFPCGRHAEDIADLKRGQKGSGAVQINLALGDLGKVAKAGAAVLGALAVVAAALRDQLGQLLPWLGTGKPPGP